MLTRLVLSISLCAAGTAVRPTLPAFSYFFLVYIFFVCIRPNGPKVDSKHGHCNLAIFPPTPPPHSPCRVSQDVPVSPVLTIVTCCWCRDVSSPIGSLLVLPMQMHLNVAASTTCCTLGLLSAYIPDDYSRSHSSASHDDFLRPLSYLSVADSLVFTPRRRRRPNIPTAALMPKTTCPGTQTPCIICVVYSIHLFSIATHQDEMSW